MKDKEYVCKAEDKIDLPVLTALVERRKILYEKEKVLAQEKSELNGELKDCLELAELKMFMHRGFGTVGIKEEYLQKRLNKDKLKKELLVRGVDVGVVAKAFADATDTTIVAGSVSFSVWKDEE